MRDLHSAITTTASIVPQGIAVETIDGDSVDMTGYDSLEVVFSSGDAGVTLGAVNKYTLIIEDSADDSTFAATEAADLIGLAGAVSIPVTEDAICGKTLRFGYIGGKRYVRASITGAGTLGTDTIWSANLIQSNAAVQPCADQLA